MIGRIKSKLSETITPKSSLTLDTYHALEFFTVTIYIKNIIYTQKGNERHTRTLMLQTLKSFLNT